MTYKTLLNEYKSICKEMQATAAEYRSIKKAVAKGTATSAEYKKFNDLWKKLLILNEKAYGIMLEYRQKAQTAEYKILFALRLIKKQNGLQYVKGACGKFIYMPLLSIVNI